MRNRLRSFNSIVSVTAVAALIACFATAPTSAVAQESGLSAPETVIALVSLRFLHTDNVPAVELSQFVTVRTSKVLSDQRTSRDQAAYACILRDADHHPIQTLYLKDPFVTRYEYPDGEASPGSVEIAEVENAVLLRFPYNPQMQFLQVVGFDTDRREVPVTEFTLPHPSE